MWVYVPVYGNRIISYEYLVLTYTSHVANLNVPAMRIALQSPWS